MRTQNEISKALFRFPAQIVHFVGIPFVFVAFALIYKPESLISLLTTMHAGVEFNLIIVGCIMLLTLVGTRLAFYFLRKVLHLNTLLYIGWCFAETVIFSMFSALYIHLISGMVDTYFNTVASCLPIFGGVVVWPYVILLLYYTIVGLTDQLNTPSVEENGLIRFKDESQKLKLVVASSSILYIEAKENYVDIVYTDNGTVKRYTLRSSMKRLEEPLHSQGFQRCHRAYYINPKHIKVLGKDEKGYMVANLDVPSCPPIPVSKTYYAALSAML